MLCLFEDAHVARLAPLALTRAAFGLRGGALTLAEGLVRTFGEGSPLTLHTRAALTGVTAEAYPEARVRPRLGPEGGVLLVNGRLLAREGSLADRVRALPSGGPRALVHPSPHGDVVVAAWLPSPPADLLQGEPLGLEALAGVPTERVEGGLLICGLPDLIADLEARVAYDVEALGGLGEHAGARIEVGAILAAPERIHLAPGAVVRAGAVISAHDGPVRIEAGATIEENAVVRGPCWIGPGATVKAAGRVDGSAIGPQSKVGGEVHASVVQARSGKAHDGYLGNSYLGEWCNLGADSNTSNLKNDYGEVTVFDPVLGDFAPSGRQFMGLVMGDHAKCSINTMFNTGTVVGVACNLFGAGFPPRHVPSFAWGGSEGFQTYRLDKALRVAEAVMARRGRTLSAADRALLQHVFEATAPQREGWA